MRPPQPPRTEPRACSPSAFVIPFKRQALTSLLFRGRANKNPAEQPLRRVRPRVPDALADQDYGWVIETLSATIFEYEPLPSPRPER
jgi:hypothetical protein